MQIIPAIDFKDGRVVNLKQGQLEQTTEYSDDPIGMADRWVAEGAHVYTWLILMGRLKVNP